MGVCNLNIVGDRLKRSRELLKEVLAETAALYPNNQDLHVNVGQAQLAIVSALTNYDRMIAEMRSPFPPKPPRGKSTRPRDGQRKRVYKAEAEWLSQLKVKGIPYDSDIMDLHECSLWANKILNRVHMMDRRGGCYIVEVTDGRGRRSAAAELNTENGRGKIFMPKWSRHLAIIIHEVAHLIEWGDNHGPEFAKRQLQLVRDFIGAQQAALLVECYQRHGVRFGVHKPKRRRPA